nr:hypothetical protein [Tanacetum cinerariifolium]
TRRDGVEARVVDSVVEESSVYHARAGFGSVQRTPVEDERARIDVESRRGRGVRLLVNQGRAVVGSFAIKVVAVALIDSDLLISQPNGRLRRLKVYVQEHHQRGQKR